MKNILFIPLILLLVSACKEEENGSIVYKLIFSSLGQSGNARQSSLVQSSTAGRTYTGFGDYIESVTPSKYVTNFNFLFCQGNKYVLNYTGNHWEDSTTSTYLKIDFSENKEVSVEPVIMKTGGPSWIECKDYEEKQVSFNYFSFTAYYFYQTFELPEAYAEVTLDQLNPGLYYNNDAPERAANLVKAYSSCLFRPTQSNWQMLRFNFGEYHPEYTPFIIMIHPVSCMEHSHRLR